MKWVNSFAGHKRTVPYSMKVLIIITPNFMNKRKNHVPVTIFPIFDHLEIVITLFIHVNGEVLHSLSLSGVLASQEGRGVVSGTCAWYWRMPERCECPTFHSSTAVPPRQANTHPLHLIYFPYLTDHVDIYHDLRERPKKLGIFYDAKRKAIFYIYRSIRACM